MTMVQTNNLRAGAENIFAEKEKAIYLPATQRALSFSLLALSDMNKIKKSLAEHEKFHGRKFPNNTEPADWKNLRHLVSEI